MTNYEELSDEELMNLYLENRAIISHKHNEQMSIKIQINSLYGALANIYFTYYNLNIAEAITTSGQLSLRWAMNAINAYMNKILKTENVDYAIYGDTDSCYVSAKALIEEVFGTSDISKEEGEKFLDEFFATNIQKLLDKEYDFLSQRLNAYGNHMHMGREKICDRAVFTGKKRYILNVLNSEGVHYDIPKISVTGIESVRSSTPDICREKFDEAFKIIMNGNEKEIQKFISDFRAEFKTLSAEDIARNTSANDIKKYEMKTEPFYIKGTPQHIRGSILYNKELKNLGLEKTRDAINPGDKVKLIYLNMPNPIRENVIAFPQMLPKEFGLEKYIDYDLQFEKVFLDPLVAILRIIGWQHKEIANLEQFFT